MSPPPLLSEEKAIRGVESAATEPAAANSTGCTAASAVGPSGSPASWQPARAAGTARRSTRRYTAARRLRAKSSGAIGISWDRGPGCGEFGERLTAGASIGQALTGESPRYHRG